VTDGRHVYAWFGSEGLYCYDFSGKLAWKKSLGAIATQGMGNGTSPVLYENLVILQCDEDNGEKSFIVALDKRNGKEIWRAPRQVEVSWTTPVIARAPGRVELVASGSQYIAAYDPATGKELWRCKGTEGWTVSTPLVGHGIVIASAAHPVKRAVAIRLGGSGDVTDTPQVVWQRDKGTGYTPSSILYGDYAYLMTDRGILTCVDVRTGEVKYEGGRVPKPATFSASPVAYEDNILLSSEDGDVFVLKAGPKHEVLRTNSLDEPIYASPAIANGAIFIRTVKHLYCIANRQARDETAPGFAAPQTNAARRTLDFYFIDVEGGAATLVVTPAGEAVLLDAGWDGFEGRDAKRIRQAMWHAGITEIDHLVTTHYHRDHYGGVPELAMLVPIRHFYDHGKMTSLTDDPQFAERYGAYQAAAKGQTAQLKPGDTIPLKTTAGGPPIKLLCVAARSEVMGGAGASANPACTSAAPNEDSSDNARSVALLLKFGDFDFLNLADLSWNVSKRLVCPANQIGEVDLYQVTHHGGDVSNDAALLRSLRPTVAVMINGPRKGGHPDAVKWLRDTPSLKALYQLHRNVQTTAEQNAPPEFIANLDEQPDAANMITVAVDATKRAFTVTNGRTKESRSYQFK
jgi:beta-lactamase superfamily II metal-dependent hydrolase/outer membrane protein assembly factor BamB